MKNITHIIIVLFPLWTAASFAAEIKGDVEINVQAGNISQEVGGIKSKNELKLGTVSGDAKVQDMEINVKTGDVVQKSKGLWKESKVKIGNVE
jgi:hypothetical protein